MTSQGLYSEDYRSPLSVFYLRSAIIEDVAQPWENFTQSSAYTSPLRRNPVSCTTRWLWDILKGRDQDDLCSGSSDIPASLSEIRDSFSLSMVQLAQVLGVTRQAVYDWREGKSVKSENRQRIGEVLSLSRRWANISKQPVGRMLTSSAQGTSLLELLSADRLDSDAIVLRLKWIAEQIEKIEGDRPPSAREMIERHGMKPVSEDQQRMNVRSFFLAGRRGR